MTSDQEEQIEQNDIRKIQHKRISVKLADEVAAKTFGVEAVEPKNSALKTQSHNVSREI